MPTSLDSYFPFDSGPGAGIATELKWRSMFRHVIGSGPLVDEDDEMETVGDSTGMNVKVKTGKAWVHGHYGENTSQKTLTIATAHATLARIDRVVLRANFTDNVIEFDVLTGTAAGSPVAPSLTQSSSIWEISLATVAVGAAVSTITAGNVTDTRPLQVGGEVVAGAVPYTPTIGGTGWALGNGTIVGSYIKIGDKVHVSVKITWGSTSTYGSVLTVSLPVISTDMAEAGVGIGNDAGVLFALIAPIGASAATVYRATTNAAMALVTNSTPFTWVTGDILSLSLDYEAA